MWQRDMLLSLLLLLETEQDKVDFHNIYEHTYRQLIYVGIGIMGNKLDAEELVQDAFVKIASDFPKYRGLSLEDMRGLLVVIVRNLCINRIHERERHKETLIKVDESLLGMENDPLEKILTKELSALLEKAMRKLPERDRDIFTLRYYYDLSYKQIGDIVGIKPKAVDMRLYRAKRKLREVIEHERRRSAEGSGSKAPQGGAGGPAE